MATTSLFFPAGVKIGSVYLAHVGEQSIDQKLEDLFVHPTGDWAPNFTGSKSYAPEVGVESMDLVKALDLMTINALCADLTAVDVDLYQRKVQSHGMAYATGDTEHLVYRLTDDAMLYWEQIQVNQNDEAKISLKLVTTDNGTNEPLLQVPSQSIEAAGEQNAPFTLGPIAVILDGAATEIVITGIKSFSWNNNPEVVAETADGDESPGFVALQRVRPVCAFETTDLAALQSNFCTADQKGVGLDRLRVFFRRRRPNKINYLNNEAVHLKLEADIGQAAGTIATLKWKRVSGDPAKAAVEIHVHRAGTNALFTVTKNTAITTGTGTTTTTSTTTSTTTTS